MSAPGCCEHARCGVAVCGGRELRLELVSPTFAALYRTSAGELTGAPLSCVFDPGSVAELDRHLRLAREQGHLRFQALHVRSDGCTFPARIELTVTPEQDGEALHHVVHVEDITEVERDIELVRSSEARYRALLEHAPEAIVVLDVETGRFDHVNANAATLFRLARERLLEVGPIELSPPTQPGGRPSAEAARAKIAEALAGGTPTFEWVHRAADGCDIPCEVRLVRLPDPARVLVRGSVTDISDRKRAERERERAAVERRLAARAHVLQQVTDAALSQLSLEALLPTLVGRVAAAVDVDAADIFLLEDHGELELRAACGLDAAHVGMCVPLGEGFAGRVAVGRRALALYGADATLARSPALRDAHALVGVPLLLDDRVVGVLSVAALEQRHFSGEDLDLLQLAAERVAIAIGHARLFHREREIATALQKSLLPDHLPDIPGTDIAALYRPAGEGCQVGGDFYDAFPIDDRRWLVVIGDVCGKGPEAAAVTALVHYTLRADALHQHQPGRLLALVNDAIIRQRTDERFVTAACLRLDLGAAGVPTRATIALGGHPPALIARNSGAVDLFGLPGTLLGVLSSPQLPEQTVDLAAGETVLLYTDGLLEAHAPVEVLDPSRLASLATGAGRSNPRGLIEHLDRQTIGDERTARDDVAMIALRLTTRVPATAASTKRSVDAAHAAGSPARTG